MELDYTKDIKPHLPATAGEVKAIFDADPRTVRDIPVPDLANLLHHKHPLGFINPETNSHYGPLVEIRKNPGAAGAMLVAGIDRLIHHIHQPSAKVVECSSDTDVATLLHAIVSRLEALADDPAITPYGVDVEAVKADLQALHGGRKYDGVTEADIQAKIDAKEADDAKYDAYTLVDEGYHRARVVIDDGETDWTAIVAAFNGGE